jgi:predicted HAD superfamily Cof-like phosphohydrolase
MSIEFCALNINMDTNITVTDLIAIRNIMNTAAERGAFKAEEMAEVGTTYNKLNQFLEAVITQAQAQEQAADTAATPQGE